MKTLRIGNAAGFWGDQLDAPRRLAESGGLDYLTLEYLAELTMSILAHQKSRNPEAGFVTDFPTVLESLIPSLQSQPQLKIVTNAGGMNPSACARHASKILLQAGLSELPIAIVEGDNLLPDWEAHRQAGEPFCHFETGQPVGELKPEIVSAHAYLGAGGIVDALRQNARIVLTGRVADASLTVGPALFEFDWQWDAWPRLAGATVAGHLIECGAQVTGGFFSAWNAGLPLAEIGYPIAEIASDGTAVITKPNDSGGRVTTETVAEQLVYEVGDPAHYLTPDVDADFSQVRLEQVGPDRVKVSGARGNGLPPRLKVSAAYRDGFQISGTLVVCGRNAVEKAQHCARMIFDRLKHAGIHLERTNVECLGAGDSLPGVWPSQDVPPWEVVLRISAHDPSEAALQRLGRELAPLVTSGPPGVTGYTGGRPRPHPVFAYWPTTVDRNRVSPQVTVQTAAEWGTP